MSELDTLIPPSRELILGGEAVTITPLKVGQLPALLRAITPFMQRLTSPEIDWLALLGEHGEALLSALAVVMNKPRAWVDALETDEALLLAATLIEVNADFFTQRVLPRLDGLFASVTPTMANPTPGSMPSNA